MVIPLLSYLISADAMLVQCAPIHLLHKYLVHSYFSVPQPSYLDSTACKPIVDLNTEQIETAHRHTTTWGVRTGPDVTLPLRCVSIYTVNRAPGPFPGPGLARIILHSSPLRIMVRGARVVSGGQHWHLLVPCLRTILGTNLYI
jgi:hypothetical protein